MSDETQIETAVVDAGGAEVARVSLPGCFSGPVNDALLFEQVLSQLASRRSGTAATKTRGKVRGGGSKPWRQKGTGRARAGSSRSPIWRGGGTIFGPQPRSYAYRLPRSARRSALASALAQKQRDEQLLIVDRLVLEEPKTRLIKPILSALGVLDGVLIVLQANDLNVELAARNLPHVLVTTADGLNVYDVLRHRSLVIEREALDAVEARVEA